MSKLNDLLKEMAGEIPGLVAAGITGADGMTIAEYSADPNFKIEVAAGQFALIMTLCSKTTKMMGDTTEDVLVTTKGAYLLARDLDGFYHLGVAVAKEGSSLGNVRLITQQFSNDILNAIPKRGK